MPLAGPVLPIFPLEMHRVGHGLWPTYHAYEVHHTRVLGAAGLCLLELHDHRGEALAIITLSDLHAQAALVLPKGAQELVQGQCVWAANRAVQMDRVLLLGVVLFVVVIPCAADFAADNFGP